MKSNKPSPSQLSKEEREALSKQSQELLAKLRKLEKGSYFTKKLAFTLP